MNHRNEYKPEAWPLCKGDDRLLGPLIEVTDANQDDVFHNVGSHVIDIGALVDGEDICSQMKKRKCWSYEMMLRLTPD